VEKSYKKAASDTGNIVSAQTVMNKVRNAETLQIAAEPKTFEETPEELHIFADEDHVTYKDGKKGIVKFAVLSEGKEQVYEYRNRLINRVAFATVTKSNEEFWSEVLGYITQRYDMAKVKCIYLHADGGTWIKKAEEIIPNLKVYLDEFHIRKYLRKLPKEKEYKEIVNAIYKSLDINDKEEFTVQIEKLNNMVSDEKLKKKTEEVKKYIENNWEPVVNRLSKEITGSCTEAMNDHICAERISYHGCAWDRYSLEKLITERIYILNGGVIIAENMDKEKCVIEKDENGHRRIKRFEPKEKNLHAKYFEEQFKANIQNLDFSMFDNHHEYRFFGPVNDIISILGHKRIFSA